jgi:hypothetical protein
MAIDPMIPDVQQGQNVLQMLNRGPSQVTNPQQQIQQQTERPAIGNRLMQILSNVGGGIRSALQNPEFIDRAIVSLEGLQMNPNVAIMQQAQQRITQRAENEQQQQELNKTADYFISQGRPDLAETIYALPDSAPDILTNYLNTAMGVSDAELRSYAPIQDAEGNWVLPTFNPQTGVADIAQLDIAGESPADEWERERQQRERADDINRAFTEGETIFRQAQTLDTDISYLNQGLRSLEGGADTGVFRSYLPSFDAATAQLRSISNRLGINILNMATFGSLSGPELRLALSTPIDISLEPEELKKQIRDKIAAQAKLRNELGALAVRLRSGDMRYTDFIREQQERWQPREIERPENAPSNWDSMTIWDKQDWVNQNAVLVRPSFTDEAVWNRMSPDQQRQYLSLGE